MTARSPFDVKHLRQLALSRTSLAVLHVGMCLALASPTASAQINFASENGVIVYSMRSAQTQLKICPEQGANVFSLNINGREFLRQPKDIGDIAGVSCGVPILYPTPNRVRDSKFTFDGTQVSWEPNAQGNFIHGLVNRLQWEVTELSTDAGAYSLRMIADFRKDSKLLRQFPFAHTLYLTVEVGDRRVRWTYQVDNTDGTTRVPFGFALHPYFVYQGKRSQTYLTIPATHLMYSEKRLPTGQLIAASELDYPLGQPMSLEGTNFDDVFTGIRPKQPTRIDFRDEGCSIKITASEAFTHLVVWTPSAPYFGVESQTCSTDAHNLFTKGLQDAAHLQICDPGAKKSGWVEYRFSDQVEAEQR